MSKTYELETKVDAEVDYKDIRVKITDQPEAPAPKVVSRSLANIDHQITQLDDQIAILQAKRDEWLEERSSVVVEVDKVTGALNKV